MIFLIDTCFRIIDLIGSPSTKFYRELLDLVVSRVTFFRIVESAFIIVTFFGVNPLSPKILAFALILLVKEIPLFIEEVVTSLVAF